VIRAWTGRALFLFLAQLLVMRVNRKTDFSFGSSALSRFILLEILVGGAKSRRASMGSAIRPPRGKRLPAEPAPAKTHDQVSRFRELGLHIGHVGRPRQAGNPNDGDFRNPAPGTMTPPRPARGVFTLVHFRQPGLGQTGAALGRPGRSGYSPDPPGDRTRPIANSPRASGASRRLPTPSSTAAVAHA